MGKPNLLAAAIQEEIATMDWDSELTWRWEPEMWRWVFRACRQACP
jgi:hypothetical protein